MTSPDDVRTQVLHAVRILGYAGASRVSERTGLPVALVDEALLDAQAAGQVKWTRLDDDGGWSLTEAGRADGERRLAEELESAGARDLVVSVMIPFEPLNRLVTDVCGRWQLAEMGIAAAGTSLAETVEELARAGEAWHVLEERLVRRLPRFGGYHRRFGAAVRRASSEPAWLTGTDRDSAHRVWFELHEDLLATLGRSR
jgi:hypothetical protein